MAFSGKYNKLRASSLLESVIALSIISICLYISIVVYSSVFSAQGSSAFYLSDNEAYELFFMSQVQDDSISEKASGKFVLEEETITPGLKEITISKKDSIGHTPKKHFFINAHE